MAAFNTLRMLLVLVLVTATKRAGALPRRADDDPAVPMGPSGGCDNGQAGIAADMPAETAWQCAASERFSAATTCPCVEKLEAADLGAQHRCMSFDLATLYLHGGEEIPSSGQHRPVWAVFGEYEFLPTARWLHNLEHGSIVFLYHPCTPEFEVAQMRAFAEGCAFRSVLTPYPFEPLDAEFRFAMVAWRSVIQFNCWSSEAARVWVRRHLDHGREAIARLGLYDHLLVSPFPAANFTALLASDGRAGARADLRAKLGPLCATAEADANEASLDPVLLFRAAVAPAAAEEQAEEQEQGAGGAGNLAAPNTTAVVPSAASTATTTAATAAAAAAVPTATPSSSWSVVPTRGGGGGSGGGDPDKSAVAPPAGNGGVVVVPVDSDGGDPGGDDADSSGSGSMPNVAIIISACVGVAGIALMYTYWRRSRNSRDAAGGFNPYSSESSINRSGVWDTSGPWSGGGRRGGGRRGFQRLEDDADADDALL